MSGSTAFFGASTGVGLSALKTTLTSSRTCTALCRKPAKLTSLLPTSPNLSVIQGNIYDKAAVTTCIKAANGTMVDEILFTIGSGFSMSNMGMEDAHVCENGITVVLDAIADLRRAGVAGNPHIVVFSSTGISKFGRDIPALMVPFYYALKTPHEDKVALENKVAASGASFTIVRASLLVNGESKKTVRVGLEDPKHGVESKAIGYTISREDAGKWVAQNLVLEKKLRYVNKTATITY